MVAIFDSATAPKEVPIADDGETSPVGSALLSLRRARAFNKAVSADGIRFAQPTKMDAKESAIPVEGLSQAALDSVCQQVVGAQSADGIPQSELDTLSSTCDIDTDRQEDYARNVKRLRAFGRPGEAEAFIQAIVAKTNVDSADELVGPSSEDIAHRIKRIRAFGNAGEAKAIAMEAMAKAFKDQEGNVAEEEEPEPQPDFSLQPKGLSQDELDALCVNEECVVMPGNALHLPCPIEKPEAACFLLRRARAFRGVVAEQKLSEEFKEIAKESAEEVAAAEKLAAEAAAAAEAPKLAARPNPVKPPMQLQLPCSIKRGDDSSPSRSLSPKDGIVRVATPSRRRLLAGRSPIASPISSRSPIGASSPLSFS